MQSGSTGTSRKRARTGAFKMSDAKLNTRVHRILHRVADTKHYSDDLTGTFAGTSLSQTTYVNILAGIVTGNTALTRIGNHINIKKVVLNLSWAQPNALSSDCFDVSARLIYGKVRSSDVVVSTTIATYSQPLVLSGLVSMGPLEDDYMIATYKDVHKRSTGREMDSATSTPPSNGSYLLNTLSLTHTYKYPAKVTYAAGALDVASGSHLALMAFDLGGYLASGSDRLQYKLGYTVFYDDI